MPIEMAPPTPIIVSLAEVDETTLAEIAGTCHIPTNQIEDVYACTHVQMEMIAGPKAEVYHIVLSFGPKADIDRFCEALRKVVSLNAVLRTRFVNCRLGTLQVVTSEAHVTERRSGDVEQYLRGDKAHHGLVFGRPAFRSTFIDNKFVATIDHTVMDYWSLTTFLTEDVMAVYSGHAPKIHAPFKEFVAHCTGIDESIAKNFWAPRFKGVPAVFPRVIPGFAPHGGKSQTRKFRIDNGVSPAHLPSFVEAAWAMTAGVYADSDSIAFSTALSGRSPTLNGVETTLGPVCLAVPVQVNLQHNMTVAGLIKDRATSLRQMQTHPALQYGNQRIATLSEAARIAVGSPTLLNIRAAGMVIGAEANDDFINFERVVQPESSFAIHLICSLLDDEILVDIRYDPAVICERQMHRVLNQFEHILNQLMEAPSQTKLDKLQLLNPHDRSEILHGNKNIPETVKTFVHKLAPELGFPKSIGMPIGIWIVNPQNANELTPIGGVGELLIEGSGGASEYPNSKAKTAVALISPPSWTSSCERKGTCFYRTGDLVRYNADCSISFVGRKENRVKLGGQRVQLEEVESVLASCSEVRDVVTLTKISAGRTQLVAVVCIADPQLPQSLPGKELAERHLNAVRVHAKSMLPSEMVPTIWLTVEQLPRTLSGKPDRAVIREWLRSVKT